MKQVGELQSELKDILGELRESVEVVGAELIKLEQADTARVTLAMSRISMVARKFLFFVPEIANARTAEVELNGSLSALETQKWAELTSEATHSRTWMTQWSAIETLIRNQIPPQRRKLFKPSVATDDISISQNMVNDQLLDSLYKTLNNTKQNETAREHGCFADIAFPQSVFIEHVHAARRILLARRPRHPVRFLDVGCGGGLKVLSASAFFDRADGLEFDPGYVAAAETLFKNTRADRCNVIEADGLNYAHYDNYDVVYFYRPMRHIEMLRQLEDQIIKTVRPGTLIIAPYTIFEHRFKELGCARVERQIYITQVSQSDADKLRRDAEFTGSFAQFPPPIASTIWDPILKASRAMGFKAGV
ncbi:class I SAM-dependent methyltransferase [Falsihalocynthiibacter sp. S25ZX9]|uniref:class I SAM-dependent methyltransferase n=1 Tax=Falsihalocynthiibacter sp. S25ZX9 TaxID=3240870 RepID=UPI00350EBB7E